MDIKGTVMEKDKRIGKLYADFHKEMYIIEEQREQITREMGKIDAEQSIFDDIRREMNWLFREIKQHCEGEQFIADMENCEDEFYDCQRSVENELKEQREVLETEQRNTYRKEDELREELHSKEILLDRE